LNKHDILSITDIALMGENVKKLLKKCGTGEENHATKRVLLHRA
jgi:hypothetical protein